MGLLTDFTQQKVTEEVNSKRLVIWLDKEGEFTPVVDAWVERYQRGDFPFPVFAFRGSFLELMMASRAILAQKDTPRCLIHMPGFNESTIKATPLYEAYQAGKRLRQSLTTWVREMAQGKLTPDQVDYLLDQKLTFAELERELQGKQESPPEVQSLLVRYGEDGLVREFLTNPGRIYDQLKVASSARFGLVHQFLERLLGLDLSWLKAWNLLDPAGTAEDQAEALAAYLLCLEFAEDLSAEAPSVRLRDLKAKPKNYKLRCERILNKLRSDTPQIYSRWAELVEAGLTPEETSVSLSALGEIDTFRFEADLFLREAMVLLSHGKWNEALLLARLRLPKGNKADIAHSFWITRDPQRSWLWQWIEAAGELGHQILHYQSLPSVHANVADLMKAYADSGWSLDRLHRQFAVLTERSGLASANYAHEFISVRQVLARLYRDWIDTQARHWNQVCEASGFLGPSDTRQRQFFRQHVKPLAARKVRTAVLFVDALRYELGMELVDLLKGESLGTVEAMSMLAELPTITAVGMSALVPTANAESLQPLFDSVGGAVTGFQTGERKVTSPDTRHKTLQEVAGVSTSWTSLEDFLAADAKTTKQLTSAELVVVTTQEIDAMGETGALGFGFDYFDKGIARVKLAVRKLRDAGCLAIVITADHGFLLGDSTLQNNRAPKLSHPDRRYAIDTPRTSENLLSASFGALDYAGAPADQALVFERSSHLLSSKPAGGFYHGGNTPQERIIPVITVTSPRALTADKGHFRVAIEKCPPLGDYQRLKVKVDVAGVPELFAKSTLELRLVAEAGAITSIFDVVGGKFTGDLMTVDVETTYEVGFTLKGTVAKCKIRFEATQAGNTLENAVSADYFDVQRAAGAGPATEAGEVTFSALIPSEFHTALKHLAKHGQLTESFLVNSLGRESGPRKSRVFANKIGEWMTHLPFNVKIENTAEGKTYRKDA